MTAREDFLSIIERESRLARKASLPGNSIKLDNGQITVVNSVGDELALESVPTFEISVALTERKGGNLIVVPDRPLTDFESLYNSLLAVRSRTFRSARILPEGDPWREDKIIHMLCASTEENGLARVCAFRMREENFHLLMFIASIHDIGRIKEAINRQEGRDSRDHHGYLTAEMLDDWDALSSFSEKTQQLINYVVIHHADQDNMPLPEGEGEWERLMWLYLTIIRDLDKLSLFFGKTSRYLYDEAEIKVQISRNDLKLGMAGSIEPKGLIDVFENNQTINRSECLSYEAYILQYLAWIYDLSTSPAIEDAMGSGFAGTILDWFETRIDGSQFDRIKRALCDYREVLTCS